MYQIKLADGRWIEVSASIYYDWNGEKKTKNHCSHVLAYWREMYDRANQKYYAQMMEG